MERINQKSNANTTFARGDKVVFLLDGRIYDFGYMGATGKAIIYEEGEMNMQDASAVDIGLLKKLKR